MSSSDSASIAASTSSRNSDSSATSISTTIFESPVDISQAPAALFAQLLSGPLVNIDVGSGRERRSWSLHRNLLAHHSPVLSARFNDANESEIPPSPPSPVITGYPASPFTTAKATRGSFLIQVETASPTSPRSPSPSSSTHPLSLSLPSVSPDAFALFVKYLYQGTLTPVSSLPNNNNITNDPTAAWDYAFLCQQVYALAASLSIPTLQNRAMDEFRAGCHASGLVPGADEMLLAYRSTQPGCELRKLVAQLAARQVLDPENEKGAVAYRACFFEDPEFAVDLVDAMRRGVGGLLLGDPNEERGCRFHLHAEGEVCLGEGVGMGNGRRRASGILKKKVTFEK